MSPDESRRPVPAGFDPEAEQEVDFGRYWRLIAARWWLVFVGLVISLGSSGIVNQLMSGLTLTYSRVLTVGDSVRIGECEGVVTTISLLSVKLRTFQGEEITVPNAVVVGQSTTNYTKLAASGGSYLATSVSIGYDTPWRQVRSLLLLAAARTANVRREPPARVVQDAGRRPATTEEDVRPRDDLFAQAVVQVVLHLLGELVVGQAREVDVLIIVRRHLVR